MKRCLRKSCGKEFDPNKPKQKFCSDKCRVYYSRENSSPKIQNLTNPTHEVKPFEQPKTNFAINTGRISELEKEIAVKEDELSRVPNEGAGLILRNFLRKQIESSKKELNNLKYK